MKLQRTRIVYHPVTFGGSDYRIPSPTMTYTHFEVKEVHSRTNFLKGRSLSRSIRGG